VADAVRIYLALARAEYRSAWQHRASFALLTFGSTLGVVADFIVILFLFSHIRVLAGFTLAEMAVLYGLASLSERLADLAVGDLEKVSVFVKEGSFDRFLTRPGSALAQAAATSCRPQMIGRPLQAIVVLGAGCAQAGIDWTPARVILLPVLVAAGTLIFSCIWVIGASVTFATVDGREAMNAFTYGGGFAAQYPVTIFERWFRRLFCYVLPIAFVSWFPALFLLGREDPLGLPHWMRFTSPVVAAIAVVAASTAWRFVVRRYRSTGS
jgi:ABC-2 type transport system permease protein